MSGDKVCNPPSFTTDLCEMQHFHHSYKLSNTWECIIWEKIVVFKTWTEPLTRVPRTLSNAVHTPVVMFCNVHPRCCAHADRKHQSYRFLQEEHSFFPKQKKTHLIINFLIIQLNSRGFTEVSRGHCQNHSRRSDYC